MDPHKRSVTIEVMIGDETVVGGGRFGTDMIGYRSMLEVARRWPDRVWSIEGTSASGRQISRLHRRMTPMNCHLLRHHSCRSGLKFESGAACRNRTDDLFITSESLYRLS
jgi:hypothetical protein